VISKAYRRGFSAAVNCWRPPTAALSPAARAFNSVAVSIVFVVMSCGSCDGKTWEAKRMAIRFPSMPV
jgi:hypothetical protein